MAQELEHLIGLLSRLPGLGPRSARRAVLQMIAKPEMLMIPLSKAMQAAAESLKVCSVCRSIDTCSPCKICDDRDRKSDLCIVEQVSDLWAIERSGSWKGRYFVLGGVLSSLSGVGPEDLPLTSLKQHVATHCYGEVVLALNATIEGQSTAHYIADMLSGFDVCVSRLARGAPVGGELDYLDDGTIMAAMKDRR